MRTSIIIMKKFFAILSVLTLLLVFSCRGNDQIADEYRSNLDLKSELQQKELFKDLTTENKIRVWQSKINQIQTQNLSTEQKELIRSINNEIVKVAEENYDGIKLFEYAISLAKITPEDEFVRMFSVIGDYKKNENLYNNHFSNEKLVLNLQQNLNDLKNKKYEFYASGTVTNKNQQPTCNCSWTCGFYGGGTNDCNTSISGCGFLWISECGRYV